MKIDPPCNLPADVFTESFFLFRKVRNWCKLISHSAITRSVCAECLFYGIQASRSQHTISMCSSSMQSGCTSCCIFQQNSQINEPCLAWITARPVYLLGLTATYCDWLIARPVSPSWLAGGIPGPPSLAAENIQCVEYTCAQLVLHNWTVQEIVGFSPFQLRHQNVCSS